MISSLELARLCGISQGTVDRALHGRPGVSEKTRERVLEMARLHGYRPNPVAHELMSGQSNIVGILVPAYSSVFFMDFLEALKKAADQYSLRLFISPVGSKEEFLGALEDFAARRVRAVLAVPPDDGIEIPAPLERALPIATLLSPVTKKSIPLFAPDERTTGKNAVTYLAGLGHRRILHATYPRQSFPLHERQAGYESEMKTRNLSPRTCLFVDEDRLWQAIEEYEPTAVFCHNDWLALSTIRLLNSKGISVPDEMSVLGVDDSPTFNLFQTDITTMAYPVDEIANKALLWLSRGEDKRPIGPMPLVEKNTVHICPK